MNNPLRRTLAILALTAGTVTGLALTTDTVIAPPDTTWGAPDTTLTVTTDVGDIVDDATTIVGTVVTPLDTTWG